MYIWLRHACMKKSNTNGHNTINHKTNRQEEDFFAHRPFVRAFKFLLLSICVEVLTSCLVGPWNIDLFSLFLLIV